MRQCEVWHPIMPHGAAMRFVAPILGAEPGRESSGPRRPHSIQQVWKCVRGTLTRVFDGGARAVSAGYNTVVTDPGDQPLPNDRLREFIAAVVVALVIGVVVALLHGPSTELALTGDSYHWVQHAHRATHDPIFLFADLDQFFRPSATWLLAIDRVVWRAFDPAGYRVTSLLLHLMTCVCLWFVGRRCALGWFSSTAVVLIWCTSPFMSESVFVVACRHQNLLFLPWLVLILAWPRARESWSTPSALLALAMVVLAAAAKETWVVTPGLVFALELERKRTWQNALRTAAVSGIGVVAYVAVYVAAFGSGNPYFTPGLHMLARVPAQLAAFFYLNEPMPFEVRMTWQGVVAFTIVAALAAACVKWEMPGTRVALALLILPTLPTLAVPFMPVRYLAIPYAGFLLLIAGWVRCFGERQPRWKTTISVCAGALAAFVVAAGASIVRADLADYRRMADAHQVLLEEAIAVAPVVAAGGPVVVVRDEQSQPLVEILREPEGFAKLSYTRHADPYGLVDAATLFEWVIAEDGTLVEQVPDWAESCRGVEGVVLVHTEGGFVNQGPTLDVAAAALRWRERGRHTRVIRTVRR